jgi:CRP/FNR family cyclic AMP-dependent transcriptional regulator
MVKPGSGFSAKVFLSTAGPGRAMVSFRKGQSIFAQGDVSDAVFVIQTGMVRLSTQAHGGKEATLDILGGEDLVGKGSIAGQPTRTTSANALTNCQLLRIEMKTMVRALAKEVKLANAFGTYVLARNLRYQKDLAEQRCNNSEMRLAGILLRMAHLDGTGSEGTTIPRINQSTLAEMVGTTRSRVSYFMNRFKESGFIDYGHWSDGVQVRGSLLAFYGQ